MGGLDECIEDVGTDRTYARNFLEFLGLRIVSTQLEELATGCLLLLMGMVEQSIKRLYLRADSIMAKLSQKYFRDTCNLST